MNYLEFISALSVGSGAVMTGAVFIIKNYTKSLFQNQIDLYRINLEHETKIKQQEHQIKFSRLDEDRAKFLRELFSGMRQIIDILLSRNRYGDKDKFNNDFAKSMKALEGIHILFTTNLILIDESLIELVDSFNSRAARLFSRIENNRQDSFEGNNENFEKEQKLIDIELANLKDTVLKKVQEEFRRLLTT